MAQGISIHVVDVSRGVVATGMQVELIACDPRRPIAAGTIGITGLLESPALAQPMQSSHYEAVFHVAAYFRAPACRCPARSSWTSSPIASASTVLTSTTICR